MMRLGPPFSSDYSGRFANRCEEIVFYPDCFAAVSACHIECKRRIRSRSPLITRVEKPSNMVGGNVRSNSKREEVRIATNNSIVFNLKIRETMLSDLACQTCEDLTASGSGVGVETVGCAVTSLISISTRPSLVSRSFASAALVIVA
jgi:MoaA/NifB/PqqE/SkfB family radical SAM enzyme